MRKGRKITPITPNWREILDRCDDLSHSDRAAAQAVRKAEQQAFDATLPGEHASPEEMKSWQERQAEEMQRTMDEGFKR